MENSNNFNNSLDCKEKILKEEKYTKIFEINSINSLISLYEELGNSDYIGEEISQEEHAVQAAILAQNEHGDEAAILGALFHDIGHLIGLKFNLEAMDSLGFKYHEYIGSIILKHVGFSKLTCDLVENHVQTKRYLVSKYPTYYDRLSEASKGTLSHQGGKMTEEEIKNFEQNENYDLHLLMRSWDERAKVKDIKNPKLASFRDMMERNIKK